MVDANQRWEVNESIEWMKNLAQFRPLWIEEPTSPDDVLGHATISKVLKISVFQMDVLKNIIIITGSQASQHWSCHG